MAGPGRVRIAARCGAWAQSLPRGLRLRRFELGLEGGYNNNTIAELRNRFFKRILLESAALPLLLGDVVALYMQKAEDNVDLYNANRQSLNALVSKQQQAGASRRKTPQARHRTSSCAPAKRASAVAWRACTRAALPRIMRMPASLVTAAGGRATCLSAPLPKSHVIAHPRAGCCGEGGEAAGGRDGDPAGRAR